MRQKKIPLDLVFAVPFTLQVLGIVSLVGYLSYRSGQKAVEEMAYQLQEVGHRVEQNLEVLFHQLNSIAKNNATLVKQGR